MDAPSPSIPRGYWYYIEPPMLPPPPQVQYYPQPMPSRRLKDFTRKQYYIQKEKQRGTIKNSNHS